MTIRETRLSRERKTGGAAAAAVDCPSIGKGKAPEHAKRLGIMPFRCVALASTKPVLQRRTGGKALGMLTVMRHDRCLFVRMMGSDVDIEFRRKADPHQRIGKKQRTDETSRILDKTRQSSVIGVIILWRMGNHRIGAKVRYQIGDRSSGVALAGKLPVGKAEQMRAAQFRQTFSRLGSALLYQLGDRPITTSTSIRGNSDPDLITPRRTGRQCAIDKNLDIVGMRTNRQNFHRHLKYEGQTQLW